MCIGRLRVIFRICGFKMVCQPLTTCVVLLTLLSFRDDGIQGDEATDEKNSAIIDEAVKLVNEGKAAEAKEKFETIEDVYRQGLLGELVKRAYKPENVITIIFMSNEFAWLLYRAMLMEALVTQMRDHQEIEVYPLLILHQSIYQLWDIDDNRPSVVRESQHIYDYIINVIKDPIDKILTRIAQHIIANKYDDEARQFLERWGLLHLHYIEIVKKTYQLSEDKDSALKMLLNYALLDKVRPYVEDLPFLLTQLYFEMESAHQITLQNSLKIAFHVYDMMDKKTTFDYDSRKEVPFYGQANPRIKSKLTELRDKLPLQIRTITWGYQVCIANAAYPANYLVVSDQYDEDRDVVVATRKLKSSVLSFRWKFKVSSFSHQIFKIATEGMEKVLIVGNYYLPCTSGKRRALTKIPEENGRFENWEIQDHDWKNNLYLLYNIDTMEYLHADNSEGMSSRHVFTKKIVGDAPPSAVWRIQTNCF